MKQSHSHGKGSRRPPWREGGAKKSASKKWRSFVKNAVSDFEIEQPSIELTLEYWDSDISKCLVALDKKMKEHNIPYAIKSAGKTRFHQVGHVSKYVITCPEWRKELVASIIKAVLRVE